MTIFWDIQKFLFWELQYFELGYEMYFETQNIWVLGYMVMYGFNVMNVYVNIICRGMDAK